MATSSMADHVGRVLGGRYRLLTPIGTGASAQVFLAEDVTLRRPVAVKVLHPALAEDESFLRRFRAEAQQAAALNHPHAMRVFDWGDSADGPFLVLEHLGGGSLRSLLDAGHLLSPSQALEVGLQAGRGLDYAHRRGLVHRDVKPANLLFDDEGRLCIADFGLARALAEAAWTEPAGGFMGTARYASPEQVQGRSVDGKADVYSLALVLVEAITGRVPFSADTTIATLMGRVDTPLEAPAEAGPLGPVLEQAAHPDPEQRLDARGLVAGLERAAEELPPPARLPLAVRPPADDTVVTSPVAPGSRSPAPPPADDDITALGVSAADAGAEGAGADLLLPAAHRRRKRWPWVLATLLLVGLVVGAAWVVVQASVPRHPVPALAGKTVAEARTEVADEDFEIEELSPRYDETVPKGQIVFQSPGAGDERKEGSTVKVSVSDGPAPRTVPDLTNLDQAGAEAALREKGFEPSVVLQPDEAKPAGAVITWSPTGELPKGTPINLTVSSGPAPREIPDVTGKSYEEAAALLTQAGLKPEQAEVFSSDVEKGKVVSTKPGVGKAVPRDSGVTVNVSKGPDLVAIPDVLGDTVEAATAELQAAGLQVGAVFGPTSRQQRRVFLTDPGSGARVERGTPVYLYVR